MPVETKAQNLVYQTKDNPSKAANFNKISYLGLLNFYSSAHVHKFLLDRRSFILTDALFDRLRSAVDQVLGFLQPETGDFTHGLDHVNLVRARCGEDD